MSQTQAGQIIWHDLTVANAPEVAAYYKAVLGWQPQRLDHEGGDFNMNLPGTDATVAGVCHARGANAGLPPQWLMYVKVKDVAAAVEACEANGGKVVCQVCSVGYVLQDPAGAVMAILPAGT